MDRRYVMLLDYINGVSRIRDDLRVVQIELKDYGVGSGRYSHEILAEEMAHIDKALDHINSALAGFKEING